MVKYKSGALEDEALNRTFSALADPTRRRILLFLREGQATVKEIAQPFQISLPAITGHLKKLERAGLVSRGKNKQYRPVELQAGPLKEATSWLLQYQNFWEGQFKKLDKLLKKKGK